MIGDLLGAAKGLGTRFTFTGLLPFFLLGVYLAFLSVAARVPAGESVWGGVAASISGAPPAAWAALVTASLVLAVVVEPFQIAIVRVLEGYWGTCATAGQLGNVGAELHRRRVERLKDVRDAAYDAGEWERANALRHRVSAYPQDPQLFLPTRLGNALRAGETTAGERYGLGTVQSWPRMVSLLREDLRAAVGELNGQIDGGARLAVVFAVSAAASAPVLFSRGWWNLLTVVAGALALVSYLGAVNSAQRLSMILRSAYDLHRFDLLTALHLGLPRRGRDEMEANEQLTAFFNAQADSPLLGGRAYQHPQ
jgi:hypothetical protein